MPLLWVVCGAGRGVGKSWIARGLCDHLPDAVYAKHGHGEPQLDKPTTLLHHLHQVDRFLARGSLRRHLVVESNALALDGRGDVVIFVEGEPRGLPRRDDADALRQAAHIVVDLDQPISAWSRILDEHLGSGPASAGILQLLLDQAARLPGPAMAAGTKVWLELPGGHGMGKGLAQLLLQVRAHATLRKASQATGISYRHAWDLIRTAENHLGAPLIISRPGGAGGGGTSLTALGLRLIDCYQTLDRELAELAQRRLAELLSGEDTE